MAHDEGTTYAAAGVDIDAGNRAVALMKDAVSATHGPEVLAGIGAFGGLFSLGTLEMREPVLAASTDGVGTKVRLATRYGRLASVGMDLVNHCIDDILVQGARPLFFLDYVASAKLTPEDVAAVVGGMAEACRAAGCALLGGETAEMPGVYAAGEIDVVGTIVGVVDRGQIVDGRRIRPGDAVIGIASHSPHTNGYSLIRHVLGDRDLTVHEPALGAAPVDLLLRPHRSYLPEVGALRAAGVDIKGMAHITGGGLIENPPRVLPPETALRLDRTQWPVPPLFTWLAELGGIADAEMHRVFNMGLGLLVVLPEDQVERALDALGADAWHVGDIVPHHGRPTVFFSPDLQE
ncbi:MAG: phosphoribosylformylglycinamidine cyclo-ligase [Myxococcales bacterium]|nr:phosphoribosylformylglycinamidine cyclo-ligase [Myxococcales bacterium]MCB9671270.1 phosphoribosylformylglycinamidine cyclo-ligase [Alphaproteobacteria bacterium]